ncbi:Rho guanine nucleotide exchange factor 6 [Camelus dromedarius]|uniref:Rho guanine nucleotide exchange factor 6 n=1 Tax=Camelus dromedarius TaxID=9838 RepID=A0A5N4C1V3_CAMDR|nr:Rho guanine nucleotide exchange factor 6 [Camelus dromedarius]
MVNAGPFSRALRIRDQVLDLGDPARMLPLGPPIQRMAQLVFHCTPLVKDISHFPDGKLSHKKIVLLSFGPHNGSAGTRVFDPDDLYAGVNFSKVLNTLLAVNKATEDQLSERPCGRSSSLSAANSSQTTPQGAVSGTAPGLQRQSKPVEMTENGSHQLIVKARFNFKQTNEDELSVCKGDIIYVTRVEEGGWWEGTLNGRTGWFPSNYVREIKSSGK